MPATGNDARLYKRLMVYVLPYWRTFMIAIVSMLVLAISDPAIPALIKPMLDGAYHGSKAGNVYQNTDIAQ
jgi:subfamily B ATP-binding cassette protein MsbA